MKRGVGPSRPAGDAERGHGGDGRALLWGGIGVLLFLAVGFFLVTLFLFPSRCSGPKQEQARELLSSLYESELSYFAAHHCYSSDPAALGFYPPRTRYEWSIVSADCTSFLARAWANLDRDPNLDIWEITNNDAFRPIHVFDDNKDIGYRIGPRSTSRWRPENGHFQPPASGDR